MSDCAPFGREGASWFGERHAPSVSLPTEVNLPEASLHAIVPIQRRYAVGFGHGRIVEGRVDEVQQRISGSRLSHNGLADVNDLGRVHAEAVDAEYLERVAVE